MQQNEVIAIVPALRKNAGSGRDNDVGICTYDLSKFAVVVVEKARQNKIDKRPEIWLKRDSLPPGRGATVSDCYRFQGFVPSSAAASRGLR